MAVMVCGAGASPAGILRDVSYAVQTDVYEGPFDILLHLILRDEVDLYEISLSRIVDGFLAHMEEVAAALDLELTTEFLVIAATLVDLKARRLLPGPVDVEVDEELALFEQRDLLLARLIEAKTFRDAGHALELMAQAASRSWPRTAGLEERYLALAPDLLAGVTPADVHAAWLRVSSPAPPPPRVVLDHVAPIRVSMEEAVEDLMARLPGAGQLTFRALTEGLDDRIEVIVRFLAVLELYKQGLIEIGQAATFGDLEVSWVGEAGSVLTEMDSYDG
ncbi:MAG: segregation/condensation protein A [Actinomycetota bacterium]|nr:segregation/condensation protein A [Actinomycetota bacterium]